MEKRTDIYLFREPTTDQGTEGVLCIPEYQFSLYSIELPWRNNQQDISCIPPGIYDLEWTEGKYPGFRLIGVPGRSNIEIHKGNWAGDVSLGLKSDSEGCIHLGMDRGVLSNQKAVKASTDAVEAFNNLLKGKKKLRIIIRKAWDLG